MGMLDHRDDANWQRYQRVSHPGTFNANPVSAAAGVACLNLVRDPAVQKKATATANKIRAGMNDAFERRGIGGSAGGEVSILSIVFTTPESLAVSSSGGSAAPCNSAAPTSRTSAGGLLRPRRPGRRPDGDGLRPGPRATASRRGRLERPRIETIRVGGAHAPRGAPTMTYTADPRVDAYIDALPDWQQAICREVRELVHAADPRSSKPSSAPTVRTSCCRATSAPCWRRRTTSTSSCMTAPSSPIPRESSPPGTTTRPPARWPSAKAKRSTRPPSRPCSSTSLPTTAPAAGAS